MKPVFLLSRFYFAVFFFYSAVDVSVYFESTSAKYKTLEK